jgi:hypothetical protein
MFLGGHGQVKCRSRSVATREQGAGVAIFVHVQMLGVQVAPERDIKKVRRKAYHPTPFNSC